MILFFFGVFFLQKSLPKAFCPRQVHCCNHQYLAPFSIRDKSLCLYSEIKFVFFGQGEKRERKYKIYASLTKFLDGWSGENKAATTSKRNESSKEAPLTTSFSITTTFGEALPRTKGKISWLIARRSAICLTQFSNLIRHWFLGVRERLVARTIRGSLNSELFLFRGCFSHSQHKRTGIAWELFTLTTPIDSFLLRRSSRSIWLRCSIIKVLS